MELKDCIRDPKFRKEFISHEMSNIKKIVNGNDSLVYHNAAKISILEEIKKGELTDIERDIVEEHLGALMTLKDDVNKQNERLLIMVEIYNRFIDEPNKNLKLTKRG